MDCPDHLFRLWDILQYDFVLVPDYVTQIDDVSDHILGRMLRSNAEVPAPLYNANAQVRG